MNLKDLLKLYFGTIVQFTIAVLCMGGVLYVLLEWSKWIAIPVSVFIIMPACLIVMHWIDQQLDH